MCESLDGERLLPPALRTDVGILRLKGSSVEDRGDHVLLRTPQNPQFHWGNCILVTEGDVDDAQRWTAEFSRAFPEADWVAVGLPRSPGDEGRRAYAAAGLTVRRLSAMDAETAPPRTACPDGFQSRPLETNSDWEQLIRMDIEEACADGVYTACAYEPFARGQAAAARELCNRGRAVWLGAFSGRRLCSALGVVLLGADRAGDSGARRREARYQSVLTAPSHRRRGLAGHLIGEAGGWSAAAGALRWTIVTESDHPAGRLYASMGFREAEPSFEAYRAPRGADESQDPRQLDAESGDGRAV